MAEIDPHDMKLAISSLVKPCILKNIQLDWPIMNMSLENWCQLMHLNSDQKSVQFTTGSIKHFDLPYWERFRGKELMSFTDFYQKSTENQCSDKWLSHSYKDIKSWPEIVRKSINFNKLGFDNTEDILFWLGSKGANTPCHYDTYGFNIVVQVFGKKSWLLFPPDAPLNATRVPYEESSVYCKQNFYSPIKLDQFGDLGKNGDAYEVILSPGDILIVPAHWWHYVESLETSLAINTWIPVETKDASARLEECFVRTQIEKIVETEDCDDNLKKFIFNPNETLVSDINLLNLFKPLADIIIEKSTAFESIEFDKELEKQGHLVLNQHKNVFHAVQPINLVHLKEILSMNSQRYDSTLHDRRNTNKKYEEIENVINALCHPNTVRSACDLYLQQIQETTAKNCDKEKKKPK